MRVFIPTKNRPTTIQTHRTLLGQMDYRVVVHNEQQAEAYLAGSDVPPSRIVISHTPDDTFGKTRQLDWITNTLLEPGEWVLFADDNIRAVCAVDEPYRKQDELPTDDYMEDPANNPEGAVKWHRIYGNKGPGLQDPDELLGLLQLCITMAESHSANLVGFALNTNPLFRAKQWRTVGYASGKMYLWRHRPDYPWRHDISLDDFLHTAQHLLDDGHVIINNFIHPRAGHYEPGGLGTYEERLAQRLLDTALLMKIFPELFRYRQRKGFHPQYDIALRYHTAEQIDKWRARMRAGFVLAR